MSSLSQSISALDSNASDQLASKKMKRIHHEYTTSTVKRRRSVNDSTAVVTTTPFCDGYQWQKYGEKDIKNSEFRRTYYKCINEECKARKKVQQQDKYEPSNFIVIYDMQHTCNNVVQETNQNLFTIDSSPSTSTLNFGPILESSYLMMNNQQEQTLSATSDQLQIKKTENHDNISVAKAVQGDESIVDNMEIFSPLTSLLDLNENENENIWELFNLTDDEFASSPLDLNENENIWELFNLMDDELASSPDDGFPF
ncbi:probable WRKY transcription factor 4 [Dioscorea cayenensis subsp. rotundata]|uniref:Probable WRKY transcription factor 4 n=1 Tax=Dioscorea cayennensis subsp. rotundata TaxID=55577 RepID=A0AB40BZ23_DIOCR|nr:probable WRKY transcription factor 4 [Dioscorea cayenensis subsp. rotundata]